MAHGFGGTCPVLFQVGLHDRVAPPGAARLAGPRLAEYPLDHFGVYDGPCQECAPTGQLGFLARVLDPSSAQLPLSHKEIE